jgi:hypothetical protein
MISNENNIDDNDKDLDIDETLFIDKKKSFRPTNTLKISNKYVNNFTFFNNYILLNRIESRKCFLGSSYRFLDN